MLIIVNLGTQGVNKEIFHGTTREKKLFEPGVNTECSNEMGHYLLDKYKDSTKAVYFQRAIEAQEHEAMIKKITQAETPKAKTVTSEAEPIKATEIPIKRKKRGRPKKK